MEECRVCVAVAEINNVGALLGNRMLQGREAEVRALSCLRSQSSGGERALFSWALSKSKLNSRDMASLARMFPVDLEL